MAAEEEIDNETLQAQIDLSMSFAQNLVSSWVKPSPQPMKNSGRVSEAELKEYMRRPPRLGVGASIPETASSSRDTEKLKSHLSGKGGKRPREDDADPVVPKQLSDNETESRGASVKKKARIDPFEIRKKKKKEADGLAPPPRNQKSAVVEEEDKPSAVAPEEPSSPALSPSKRRKKQKHKNKNNDHPESLQDHAPLPGRSTPPPDAQDSNSTTILPNGEARNSPTTKIVDISLIGSGAPTSPSQRQKQSALLKGPILNLIGPPADGESGSEGEPDSPTHSKKKKRKRKKKKSALSAQQDQMS